LKYFIVILFLTLNTYGLTEADYKRVFSAIAQIESELNPKAYNKRENAVGIVQIRSLYLIDANEYLKTKYSHKDCYDVSISYALFKAYMKRWKAKTLEECIRLHNGGCNWKRKAWKTNRFYNKVIRRTPDIKEKGLS
jgi:hypothetical protein